MRYIFIITLILIGINVTFAQTLTGNYTIGDGNPDFNTVTEAVSALKANGGSGPATFNLRAAIYEINGCF